MENAQKMPLWKRFMAVIIAVALSIPVGLPAYAAEQLDKRSNETILGNSTGNVTLGDSTVTLGDSQGELKVEAPDRKIPLNELEMDFTLTTGVKITGEGSEKAVIDVVEDGGFDRATPGEYKVVYKVTSGEKVLENIKRTITVTEYTTTEDAPLFYAPVTKEEVEQALAEPEEETSIQLFEAYDIKETDSLEDAWKKVDPDLTEHIKVFDKDEKEVTEYLKVKDNDKFDISVEGEYLVDYSVEIEDTVVVQLYRKVTVGDAPMSTYDTGTTNDWSTTAHVFNTQQNMYIAVKDGGYFDVFDFGASTTKHFDRLTTQLYGSGFSDTVATSSTANPSMGQAFYVTKGSSVTTYRTTPTISGVNGKLLASPTTSVSGNTITTTWPKVDGLTFTRTYSMVPNSRSVGVTFSVKNETGSAIKVGVVDYADTFFAGKDTGIGGYNSRENHFYIKKDANSGMMIYKGIGDTPASSFVAGKYNTDCLTQANKNQPLSNTWTSTTSSNDYGYAIRWDFDLANNASHTIKAEQQFTKPGKIQVMAPGGVVAPDDVEVSMTYTLMNMENTTQSATVTVANDKGWPIRISDTDKNVTLGAFGQKQITIYVKVPPGTSTGTQALITLNAKDQSNNIVPGSASITVDKAAESIQEIRIVSQTNAELVTAVDFKNITGNRSTTVTILNENGTPTSVPAQTRTIGHGGQFTFNINGLDKNKDYIVRAKVDGVPYYSEKVFRMEEMPTALNIAPTTTEHIVKKGATKGITGTLVPSSVGTKTVEWKSSNTAVAKPVNAQTNTSTQNTINAVDDGTAIITVSATKNSSLKHEITFKVDGTKPQVDSITLDETGAHSTTGTLITSKDPIKMTLATSDPKKNGYASGVKDTYYQVASSKPTFTLGNTTGWTNCTTSPVNVTPQAGGNYVWVVTVDTVGNVSDVKASPKKIKLYDEAYAKYQLDGGVIGTNGNDVTVTGTVGNNMVPPQNPTKTGYTFKGWKCTTSGEGSLAADFTVAKTHVGKTYTFKAQWDINKSAKVQVVYKLDGGHIDENTSDITKDGYITQKITEPKEPKKAGYEFVNWKCNVGGINPTFTVAAKDIGKSYTFTAQWKVDSTKVATAVYKLKGGNISGATGDVEKTANAGQAMVVPPTPTRAGYNFGNWKCTTQGESTLAPNFTALPKHIGKKYTFEAQWTVNITKFANAEYDLKGGNIGGATTVPTETANVEVNMPKPTDPVKTGYTFKGWKCKEDASLAAGFKVAEKHIDKTYHFEAQWKIDETKAAKAVYKLSGGNINGATGDVTYSANITKAMQKPSNPVKTGYTFTGWKCTTTGEGSLAAGFTVAAKHIDNSYTFEAQWNINASDKTIAVYKLDGGNIAGNKSDVTRSANITKPIAAPANPVKTGYNFTSWKCNVAGINPSFTVVAKDIGKTYVFTAQWKIDTAAFGTVNFKLDSGKIGGSSGDIQRKANITKQIASPGTPAKTGYTFTGWKGDVNIPHTVRAEDINKTRNVTAQYKVDKNVKLTVKFDLNGGKYQGTKTPPANQVLNVQDKIQQPSNPTKGGHKFVGWNIGNTTTQWNFNNALTHTNFDSYLATGLTLKANYVKDANQKAYVSFDAHGGEFPTTHLKVTVPKAYTVDDVVLNPDELPVYPGYKLTPKKWKCRNADWVSCKITPEDMDEGGYTVVAQWVVDQTVTIPVKFDLDGGNMNGATTVADQTKYVEQKVGNPGTPKKPGYKFVGWFEGARQWDYSKDQIQSKHIKANGLTLKAKWEQDPTQTVKATFDVNGAQTPTPAEQILHVLDYVKQPSNPVRFAYNFQGWKNTATKTMWNFGTQITHTNFVDVPLKAEWKVDPNVKIEIRFDPQKGAKRPPNQYLTVESLVTEPTGVARYGWLLKGWSLEPKSDKLWKFATDQVPAEKDGITLYAQWYGDPDMSFDVHFNPMGGKPVPPTQSGPAGTKVVSPMIPSKDGYDFQGWYADSTYTELWDFENGEGIPAVDEGTTLYARWKKESSSGSSGGGGAAGANRPGGGASEATHDKNITGNGNKNNNVAGNSNTGNNINGSKNNNGSSSNRGPIGGENVSLEGPSLGYWQSVKDQLEKNQTNGETWEVNHKDYKNPIKQKDTGRTVQSIPGDHTQMPTQLLKDLASYNQGNIEVDQGNYRWNFSSKGYWRESPYETVSVEVEDNNNRTVNQIMGNAEAQQFRVGFTDDWNAEAKIGAYITNEALRGKQLYMYAFNEAENKLEFVCEMSNMGNNWAQGRMPERGSSATGEYVITDVLFTDAPYRQEVPATGSLDVEKLLENGYFTAPQEAVLRTQLEVVETSTTNYAWALLGLIPVVAISGIVVYKKRKAN